MIKEFVDKWEQEKEKIALEFKENCPHGYEDIVKTVIKHITSEKLELNPDPERITLIDHGDYQGTQVYVIAEKGYQPSTYWYVYVGYGSCSGCDTFQAINIDYDYKLKKDAPNEEAIKDLMGLALDVVRDLRIMKG